MTDDGFQFKAPPHSTEAEQSVLGALLLDNQAFERIADLLTAEDFYKDDHRRIWRHISRLIEANKPADVVTVHEAIEDSEDRGKTGGAAYLGQMAMNTPSALNIRRYAEMVRNKSMQRRLAHVATEIAESALTPGGQDIQRLLDEAESKIFNIAEAGMRRGEGPVEAKPLLAKVFEQIDHLYHRDNPSGITGVPTGYAKLDQMTSGLQPGDLIILAARPSMGKTALALNIAEHVAVDNGLPVVIFSMEMSGTQLMTRMLASVSHVDSQKMRTGKLDDREWGDLSGGMSKLHEVPLYIDEGGALTATEIRSRARRLKRQHSKLGLIVIDYLQLMESSGQEDLRAMALGEITRSLKGAAKELDVPVLLLSQLSRKVEERPDKRPMLSDLRDSGAIEQDADVVLFLYRDEYYHPDSNENKGVAEAILGKQRNGPTGTSLLTWLAQYTRFENYADTTFDGSSYRPNRGPRGSGKVKNFSDFKKQAAGDEGA